MPARTGGEHAFNRRRRTFAPLAVPLVFIIILCHLVEISSGYFIPPPADNLFRDIKGDFCSRRRGEQCCPGRNDECYVPILDTICYCDIFCNRTIFDCCPDFWSHCFGAAGQGTEKPTSYPPQPTVINNCLKNGVIHPPGTIIKENCKKCECAADNDVYGGSGDPDTATHSWRCSDKVCLIRPTIIDAVNSGPYTWRSGNYSDLWGMTLDEGIKYRLGTFIPDQPVTKMYPINMQHMVEHIPEEFDAREKWPKYIHVVRDQGNCGASWAFSTTAVASDRLAIQSDGMFLNELSVQQMLSCNTRKQKGCEGGSLDRAWWFLRKSGVVDDRCYPYTSGQTDKKGQCIIKRGQNQGMCPSGKEFKGDMIFKSTPPYRIAPTERTIMREIMNNGPVQATFKVKEDFYSYRSGVYQYASVTSGKADETKIGYHSIRIIGWGIDTSAGGERIKYWLCANSWGNRWGENGYFRIIRGKNECQIESFVVGAWVKVGNLRFMSRRLQRTSGFNNLPNRYRFR